MPAAPSLLETQRAMRRAIVLGDADAIAELVVEDEIGAARRVDIYRNTAVATLVRALRLSHPAVQRLVGAEFFEGAAQLFLAQDWPCSALLDEFGADFAAFLSTFEPAAGLPYLGDVARLEWAVHQALHAPDAAPLDLQRVAKVGRSQSGRIRFVPDPSLRLVKVSWPVDEIWRAVIEDDDAALAAIDPAPVSRRLLVQRSRTSGAELQSLSRAQWRFVQMLCEGYPLAQAVDAVRPGEEDFAPHSCLAQLLAAGRFIDFSIATNDRPQWPPSTCSEPTRHTPP